MTTKQDLLAKFGSQENISAHYREMQRLSMLNPKKQKGNHKGGFNYLTPAQLKEVSRKGVAARKK